MLHRTGMSYLKVISIRIVLKNIFFSKIDVLKPQIKSPSGQSIRNKLLYDMHILSTTLSLQNVIVLSPTKRSCHHNLFKITLPTTATQNSFHQLITFLSQNQIKLVSHTDRIMMHASSIIWKLGTISPLKGTNLSMPLENNFLDQKRRLKERLDLFLFNKSVGNQVLS